MEPIDKIIEVLIYRKQNKLAKLLTDSEYDFTESGTYGSRYQSYLTTVNIYAPISKYEELIKLNEEEKQEIIKAFHVPYPIKSYEIEINNLEFFVNANKPILNGKLNSINIANANTDFWKQNYFRLFISHSSKIKQKANNLSIELEKLGISGFVAHDSIEPTKEWQKVIEDALYSCEGILALLNEDFHSSNWTDQEIGISYGQGKLIIPIRFGIDPYGFMGKFQGLQAINMNLSEVAMSIFKLLLKNDQSKENMSKAIVYKFANSSSFIAARENMNLLTELTFMDKDMLDQLIDAGDHNSQIKHSFGVISRLGNFIDTWATKLK